MLPGHAPALAGRRNVEPVPERPGLPQVFISTRDASPAPLRAFVDRPSRTDNSPPIAAVSDGRLYGVFWIIFEYAKKTRER